VSAESARTPFPEASEGPLGSEGRRPVSGSGAMAICERYRPSMPDAASSPAPKLNAVGVVTSDMGRSLAFYRLLGLEVPDTPDDDHVTIELSGQVRLMLDTEEEIRKFRPDWTRRTGNQAAIAFELPSSSALDEAYARMTAAGYRGDKEPWDAFWGQRYAQLRDPDGVPVDLYSSI
jgi:catechol 2,3-dioxygenase-like lactoylglutathione lyase family enzyme